jgi:hypothetical protein
MCVVHVCECGTVTSNINVDITWHVACYMEQESNNFSGFFSFLLICSSRKHGFRVPGSSILVCCCLGHFWNRSVPSSFEAGSCSIYLFS